MIMAGEAERQFDASVSEGQSEAEADKFRARTLKSGGYRMQVRVLCEEESVRIARGPTLEQSEKEAEFKVTEESMEREHERSETLEEGSRAQCESLHNLVRHRRVLDELK